MRSPLKRTGEVQEVDARGRVLVADADRLVEFYSLAADVLVSVRLVFRPHTEAMRDVLEPVSGW